MVPPSIAAWADVPSLMAICRRMKGGGHRNGFHHQRRTVAASPRWGSSIRWRRRPRDRRAAEVDKPTPGPRPAARDGAGYPPVIDSAFADQNSKQVVEVRLGGLDEDTLLPACADGNRPIAARVGPALLRRPVHPTHL